MVPIRNDETSRWKGRTEIPVLAQVVAFDVIYDKEEAKTESDFDPIRDSKEFKDIIG